MRNANIFTQLIIAAAVIVAHIAMVTAPAAASDKTYAACVGNAGGNTAEIIDCITSATARADADLNAQYRQLINETEGEQTKKLKDAQRAWITYRNANCTFVADPSGGTEAAMNGAACIMLMTVQRAAELKDLADKY